MGWILLIAALIIGYVGAGFWVWAILGAVALYFCDASILLWLIYVPITAIFLIPDLRIKLVTSHLVNFLKAKNMVGSVSETEETALQAGTSWIEKELFSGKPDFKKIFAENYPELTSEEQSFLDNQAEELCKMTDDWEVFQQRDLPKKAWDYLKKEKFFGMIIPKEYGGLEFSALGHSTIIAKLASRSQVLAITAMVPNSLGPAELLMHYGTDKQKKRYLPKLADGREIPCFALTEPNAGSDAASISADGEVFKDENDEIKIRMNWRKRYITLSVVSTVIGLAFRLRDPKNLLGKGKEPGITCALIPAKTSGIDLSERHDPMSVPFVNAPIVGKDVLIGVDDIIGGKDGVGNGWRMLMECLAVGRGISLPSTSTGGAKLVARVVGNYARVRKQFGTSIGKFEAVEEPMARIAGFTYMMEAMRSFTAGAVDKGEKTGCD